jgi:hypothetical protein
MLVGVDPHHLFCVADERLGTRSLRRSRTWLSAGSPGLCDQDLTRPIFRPGELPFRLCL